MTMASLTDRLRDRLWALDGSLHTTALDLVRALNDFAASGTGLKLVKDPPEDKNHDFVPLGNITQAELDSYTPAT